MTSPDAGAFAVPMGSNGAGDWNGPQDGLTKREYMATAFVAAMLAAPSNVEQMDCLERAAYALLNADTLIAALNAKPEVKS